MLSRWIVSVHATLVEIALWLALAGGALAGWKTMGVIGLIVGPAAAFFPLAITMGGLLMLGDIHRVVSEIADENPDASGA